MQATLYTTHCPKCVVLEKKLTQKNIEFDVVTDKKEIMKKGYLTAPLLEVNGKIMDFKEAVDWVNTLN